MAKDGKTGLLLLLRRPAHIFGEVLFAESVQVVVELAGVDLQPPSTTQARVVRR